MNERAGVQDCETFEVADEDLFVSDASDAIDADEAWIAEQCDASDLPY